MTAFRTKDELIAAYALTRSPSIHRQFNADAAVYVPHLYRGGFVIRGFGFSVERIGKYVAADKCGHPSLV